MTEFPQYSEDIRTILNELEEKIRAEFNVNDWEPIFVNTEEGTCDCHAISLLFPMQYEIKICVIDDQDVCYIYPRGGKTCYKANPALFFEEILKAINFSKCK